MRSVNNDWDLFIEHEAKLWRQEQEREKHERYGEWTSKETMENKKDLRSVLNDNKSIGHN